MNEIKIPAKRGTNLYENQLNLVTIQFNWDRISPEMSQRIMMILDDRLWSIDRLLKDSHDGIVRIGENQKFMIINQTDTEIRVEMDVDPVRLEVIYNPYMYENEDHANYDPEEFKKEHPVPDGYKGTLAKWYSIKFTYEDENWIFIRPGLGISFQTHEERQEFWEIMEGSPIIISGDMVYYDTKKGDTFAHDLGAIHTIINPTEKWVCIIEKYKGHFDEEDISRVFNPNHYF